MHPSGRFPRCLLSGLAVVALGLAACTGNSGDPTATTLAPIATGAVADTTAPTAPPTTTEPQRGSSLSNTAPLADPNFRFELTEGDAAGATLPIGLVELERREDAELEGRCYALIGTYTGIRAESLLVSPNVLARAELITDGDASTGDDNLMCNRGPVDDDGWGLRVDARLLPGADFNFATTFFVPAPNNLRGIRLFGTEPNAQRFFDAAVLGGLPEQPPVRPGTAPLNLTAPDAPAANPFKIGDDYQTIEATVRGVLPGFSRIDGLPGSCVAVIGTIKPTRTIGAVVNSLSVPAVNLIADGTAIQPDANRCASRQLTKDGWLGLEYAGVATGNTFAFAEFFAVSSDEPILQAIGFGDLFDAETRQLFGSKLLDDTPEAPRREGVNPKVPLRPNVKEVSTPVGTGTQSSVPPAAPPSTSPDSTSPNSTSPNSAIPGSTGSDSTVADATTPTSTDPTSSDANQSATTTNSGSSSGSQSVNAYTVSGSPIITIVNDAVWDAQVYGIVGLQSDAESATCYAILMTWAVSNGAPTDPPPVGLLSGGAYWAPAQTEAECDTTPLTNAGWQDATLAIFNDADEAAMHVFVPIFIPFGQDNFGAIGVGNVADDTNVGYVAPVRIAAPPSIPGIDPVSTPTPATEVSSVSTPAGDG